MPHGYKLSFEQLQRCLADCRKLSTVKWVHFSGGEPTLWTDGERTIADLLIEISKTGFEPGFTTNGGNFDNFNECNKLIQKYLDYANKPLRLYLSIDTFHQNFDIKSGRAKGLDNIIKCKNDQSIEIGKLLKITVISTISKDSKSLLPNQMIEHYESLGITFNFIPLRPKGKAKSFLHLCPDLDSNHQEDIGAYYQFHIKRKEQEIKSNIVLIGDDYYLPDSWSKIAKLGHLSKEIIEEFNVNL
jgi:MoaA/NifB/PqqE/SkfB family radical SAM enzyme